MRTTAWLTLTALALFVSAPDLAHADEVHLKNGRTLVGKVVGEKDGMLTLEIEGGTFSFPSDEVARIEEKKTPQERFAEVSRTVDMNDPAQVARLAEWATRNHLGEQARQLQEMVRGLELQRHVDRARASKGAGGFLEALAWATDRGYSRDVRRWLAEQAYAADPEHQEARRALHRIELEEEQERLAAEEAEAERLRHESSRADQEAERSRRDQLEALRQQLDRQEGETEALRDRLRQLEAQQQQARVRRRRTVIVKPNQGDPCQAGQQPLAPIMRGPLLRPSSPKAKRARR